MDSDDPSVLFRFRYKQQGGHTHVRVFAGTTVHSLGKCGDLVFRNEEWAAFGALLTPSPWLECLPEEE